MVLRRKIVMTPARYKRRSFSSLVPDVMKGVHIRIVGSNGGPEALEVGKFPVPECRDDDVLIKVAVAGVNRPDILQRKGVYPPPPGHSELPGLEVSGTIAHAASSSPFHIGQKVCALTNGGGYAEYVSCPSWQVLPVPKGLSMIEAGCIPETFFTVYHVLFDQSNIFQEKVFHKDKPSVLIHGGTSGIGTTALQLGKAFGAGKVFTTVGTDEKVDFVQSSLGARGINYKTEDFERVILDETNGEGVDFVLDMVAGDYVNKNLRLLKLQGRLAVIGSLGSPISSEIDMRNVMRKRLTIGGSTIRAQTRQVKQGIANGLLSNVWPLFESKKIGVVVHSSEFTLESMQAAHRLMESSTHIGKIAVIVNDDY